MNSATETQFSQKQQAVLVSTMPPALFESLSTLIQRVFASTKDSAMRTVVVTAAHPGSGVSYISSCLSTLLAERGSTLLLDGQALFTLARKRLAPTKGDCRSIKQSQLSVFGKAEAAEVATNIKKSKEAFLRDVDSLLLEFDYVIVDAPALSLSKAAQTLSVQADGVLLVVVPNETDIADVCAARKKIESTGGHLLGAIYNTILHQSATPTGYMPCNV